MDHRKYYLGLDPGSASVGIAAADPAYNILKIDGKDMIDVRLFEEGKTAKDRRMARCARRSLNHKNRRKRFLKEAFRDILGDAFFEKLKTSYLKNRESFAVLGAYPTISHLRSALIHDESISDAALYFFALLHIFNHRGHFYSSVGSTDSGNGSFGITWEKFVEYEPFFADISGKDIENILTDKSLKKKEMIEKLKVLCHVDKKNKSEAAILRALVGYSVNLFTIYPDLEKPGDMKDLKFSFKSFEKTEEEIKSIMPENPGFYLMKDLYDLSILSSIMSDHVYLSDARIAMYDKFKNDLKLLKRTYRNLLGLKEYNAMFRSEEKDSYSAFSGSVNSEGAKTRKIPSADQEALYKRIRKDLTPFTLEDACVSAADKKAIEYLFDEMERETLFQKQMTSLNSVIPNSLHYKESRIILKHAEKHFPFLLVKNDYGLTVSEQILAYLKFKMPYYIGPLKGNRSWVVWKDKGLVHPWNLSDRIDLDATIKRWINDLVRDCTYLNGEKAAPKQSLLYQKYALLNEINCLRIDMEPISVSLKQEIYNNVFLKKAKVTKDDIFAYLNKKGLVGNISQISGTKDKFDDVLSSHRKFQKIMNGEQEELFEDLIYNKTVFGKAEELFLDYLDSVDSITPAQKRQIRTMSCTGWGRLSKAFLTYEGVDKETGEIVSLIDVLWNTNMNLIEILHSDRYTFGEILENNNKDISLSDLDKCYLSGPAKRTISQTMYMVQKYVDAIGCPPEKIFLETTRSHGKKGLTTKKIADNLKSLIEKLPDKKQKAYWINLINEAEADGSIRSKRKRLYIMQLGKDLYTGKDIPLSDIENEFLYDVDHIIPQCKKKDDSIHDNLCLTQKKINQTVKKDLYPLPKGLLQYDLWNFLHDIGLMNDAKHQRLTNQKALTDKQYAEFVAQQLVLTGQSSNVLAKVLKAAYPESEIVYCKPQNVSDFRREYDLPKVRILNQDHHAHDAYLNIVVGNVYHEKFTNNPLNFIKETEHYHMGKVFSKPIRKNNDTIWMPGEDGTITTIRKALYGTNIHYSFMTVCRNGAITKINPVSSSLAKPESYLPRKRYLPDVKSYGGYKDLSSSYMILVEYENKGKRSQKMFAVPIVYKDMDPMDYCKNILHLENPKIVVPKIKFFDTLHSDETGYRVLISGKSGSAFQVRPATPLRLPFDQMKYVKNIEKYVENAGKDKVTKESNQTLYDTIYERATAIGVTGTLLPVMKSGRGAFMSLDLEDQVNTIYQILQLTQVGSAMMANLKAINGSEHVGLKRVPASLVGFSLS